MKRRLNRAYDNMTMPDSCSHRIEEKLQEGLLQQKTGHYTKAAVPITPRKQIWAAAVAAVCLVLVLSVGGSLVFIHSSEAVREREREPAVRFTATETRQTATPEDHYAVATRFPAEEVEAFAKAVRDNILTENWGALGDNIRYPITIQDQVITGKREFVEWMESRPLDESFVEAIEKESCKAMFCNWQGICMGDGQIWFNEADKTMLYLQITAINDTGQDQEEVRGKQVPGELADALPYAPVKFSDRERAYSILEYCNVLTEENGIETVADAFTVADMDGDDVCEVILRLVMAGTTDRDGDGNSETPAEVGYGFVVLRLEAGTVYGYPFRYGQMFDIKKDGSFNWSGGESRLTFSGQGVCHQSHDQPSLEEKAPADWHVYPCQRPELVLQSYEYVTGNGWSRRPGNQYYHFEGLVLGSMDNLWERQKEQLLRYGVICIEDEGTVTVFDPDAPGTALYGVLSNETGEVCFAEVGYYSCTEEKEYMGEARGLLTGTPEYWVDAHLPALGSMGRRVYSTAKLLDYLNGEPIDEAAYSAAEREQERLRILLDDFVESCVSDDEAGVKACCAENTSDLAAADPIDRNMVILSYDNLPSQAVETGGIWIADLVLREAEEPDTIWYLTVNLVKQENGWRITSCSLS